VSAKVPVKIRPVQLADAASLRATITEVAQEKWFLATVTGFSAEQTLEFLRAAVEGSLPMVVAVSADEVVGWCDIIPGSPDKGFAHVGRLGMGLRREWRGQGLGRGLMDACLLLARGAAIEKVELEVFADNAPARRLYNTLGFTQEGVKVRARKIEGRYQDLVQMARWI
jgi:RimJ/RimL family protein N-acetyltransferase